MTDYIYEFSGCHYLRVNRYKILKETDKTFSIQQGNYPYRLNKKEIDKPDWSGSFYSFDLQKVIAAALKAIDDEQKKSEEKIANCRRQLEEIQK